MPRIYTAAPAHSGANKYKRLGAHQYGISRSTSGCPTTMAKDIARDMATLNRFGSDLARCCVGEKGREPKMSGAASAKRASAGKNV